MQNMYLRALNLQELMYTFIPIAFIVLLLVFMPFAKLILTCALVQIYVYEQKISGKTYLKENKMDSTPKPLDNAYENA